MKGDCDGSVRIIADHSRRVPLIAGAWQDSPCWPHGCTIYWDSLPDNRVRIQHGENPEACREFAAESFNEQTKGGWINTIDLYAWLHAIHAYEVPAAASPRGRGAE